MREILDKLFKVRIKNDQAPIIEKIRLIAFYGFNICILGIIYIIVITYYDGNYIASILSAIMVLFLLIGLITFLSTQELSRAIKWTFIGLLIGSYQIIVSSGGTYGLGFIYFICAYLIIGILFNYWISIAFSIVITISLLIRFFVGAFYPDSIFQNPKIVDRVSIILIVAAVLNIFSCICLRYIEKYFSKMAFQDEITELPNRNKILNCLKQLIQESLIHKLPFSIIGIKISNFSSINANFGTKKSDELLKQVGKRISSLYNNCLGRWSSSIFFILINENNDPNLIAIGQKIFDKLNPPYMIEGYKIYGQFNLAVSRFPLDSMDSDELIENLISLLIHKNHFKKELIFYDQNKRQRENRQFWVITELNNADFDKEFFLLFQPKVQLDNQSIIGAEVLLRWKHPELGLIPPNEFIPLAEEMGLISGITRWVISSLFKLLSKHFHDELSGLNFALNFSVLDLKDPDMILFIEEQLSLYKIPPFCIEIEITERVQADQDPQITLTLKQLRKLGLYIAIDDFGTGYSSLSYLHKINPHDLKLDRSFVQKIISGPETEYPIINAVISMSQSLGLTITAEGIEESNQLDYLLQRGCHKGQGWLFGKPMTLEQFILRVKEQN